MFCFVCFWKTGEASEKPNTVIFEAMPKTSTQRVAWEDAVDADDDGADADNDDDDDWLAFKSQQQTKLWLFWQQLSTVVIHTPCDQSVMSSNPTRHWASFLSFIKLYLYLSNVSLNRSVEEVELHWLCL